MPYRSTAQLWPPSAPFIEQVRREPSMRANAPLHRVPDPSLTFRPVPSPWLRTSAGSPARASQGGGREEHMGGGRDLDPDANGEAEAASRPGTALAGRARGSSRTGQRL
ncbi:unnamed protein product [Arctogadus glacialis]